MTALIDAIEQLDIFNWFSAKLDGALKNTVGVIK